MNVRFLRRAEFAAIHAAFSAAFADYAVKMTATEDQLEKMLRQRSVDYALSVGAFQGDAMVGVSATGRRGDLAYVIFTGVVPEHRGRGVAGRMFETLLPALKERGVRRVGLEVIRDNAPAIAAYRRSGFRVVREVECMTLTSDELVSRLAPSDLGITRRDSPNWEEWSRFHAWQPTWQHSRTSVERTEGGVLFLEATRAGHVVGHAVVYVAGGVLAQLAVSPDARRQGVGSALLAAALGAAPSLRILNVDAGATGDLAFYAARGARPMLGQHEMVRDL